MTAVCLIDEAVTEGARLFKACEVLEISTRTYTRWKHGALIDRRKGAEKRVPRKLTGEERQAIIAVSCSDDFRDLNPYEIVSALLDKGTYIASVSSFYRVLRENNMIHHRSNVKASRPSPRPKELQASGPNQVFCWDITYLKTDVAGLYFYAYMIIDIWSRKILGWEVHAREDVDLASELVKKLSLGTTVRGTWLHADNGNPMKGSTMLMTLHALGIVPSFSRPRVSDDNPYIESFFKTLKYHRTYPAYFKNLEHAREWIAEFVDWYNTQHRHSKLGYVTPSERHDGRDTAIFERRNATLLYARELRPDRWGSRIAQYTSDPVVYLNPIPKKQSA